MPRSTSQPLSELNRKKCVAVGAAADEAGLVRCWWIYDWSGCSEQAEDDEVIVH
jgi:hypothetical protein